MKHRFIILLPGIDQLSKNIVNLPQSLRRGCAGHTSSAGEPKRGFGDNLATWFRRILAPVFVFSLGAGEAQSDERSVFPDILPQTFEIISYSSTGYKFRVIPLREDPPFGFEQPAFDDTDFNTGAGAFGSGGNCDLQTTILTEWPVNSQLLVRREVVIPEGVTNVRVMVSVDNDILGVFFNGSPIADFVPHDGCPFKTNSALMYRRI